MADSKTRGAPICCRCWWSQASAPSPYPEDGDNSWDCSRICAACLHEYDAEVAEVRAIFATEARERGWRMQAEALHEAVARD